MRKIFIGLFSFLILAGCQAQPAGDVVETQENALPTPEIKGPTEAPNVKGPSGPPPTSNSSQPQAMTETETVEYTLPTTDADFKISNEQ